MGIHPKKLLVWVAAAMLMKILQRLYSFQLLTVARNCNGQGQPSRPILRRLFSLAWMKCGQEVRISKTGIAGYPIESGHALSILDVARNPISAHPLADGSLPGGERKLHARFQPDGKPAGNGICHLQGHLPR
jgi:hypothetical protein